MFLKLFTEWRARLKLKGDHAFSVAGPRLWINLQLDVRSSLTFVFKDCLRSYLYSLPF